MKLKPLGDRVIVKALEDEVVTASGLVLPDTAKEKPQRGTVLAVGDGRWDEGARVPLSVAEGDVVIYSKYGGTEIKMDGDDVLILSEHDILAKVTGVAAPVKATPVKAAPAAAPAKKPAAKKSAAKK